MRKESAANLQCSSCRSEFPQLAKKWISLMILLQSLT